MAETTTTEPLSPDLLAPFCTVEANRHALDTPWRVGDRIYAADGRIAIELSNDPRPFAAGERRRPDLTTLFASFPDGEFEVEIPDVGPKPAHANDRWEIHTPCLRCCNAAIWIASGADTSKLDTQGDGCLECDSGWKWEDAATASDRIEIEGVRFQRRYLWAIRRLPNVKARIDSDRESMLAFVFDGGRGLLMPTAD